MYTLLIANKNYSSWSLRPWVLMQALGLTFVERLLPFGQAVDGQTIASLSPSGRVPVLEHQGLKVWDSLAITESLAVRTGSACLRALCSRRDALGFCGPA